MEIIDYSEQPPGKSTIAIFGVYLPALCMRIHKFRLIRLKNGKLLLGFPSFRTNSTTPTGNAIYAPYFEFSTEKGQEFERKVMEALKPFLRP